VIAPPLGAQDLSLDLLNLDRQDVDLVVPFLQGDAESWLRPTAVRRKIAIS
jgi:hypothetical protein